MNQSKYEDILSLPYQKSTRHPHMTAEKRAAQFSPFAALTGFEDMVSDAERLKAEEFLRTGNEPVWDDLPADEN